MRPGSVAQPGPSPPGDLGDLTEAEFLRIARLVRAEAGIELTDGKLPLVNARLTARLRSLDLPSWRAYCDFIEGAGGAAERLEMLSVLTTNVTRFFREPHHFEYLRRHLIPDLAGRLARGGSVRVWSAGCATGEEPYSLALTFLDAIPDLLRRDFRILATDIDPAVLRIAAAGIYPAHALAQVPDEQRRRHFRPSADNRKSWQVGDEIRGLVTFRRLNLIAPWPFKRPFDVIMCRNVVIYFGADAKLRVWSRLVHQLRPGGWLLTGHSERLTDDAAHLTEPLFTTTYRRRNADEIPREETTCH